MGSTTCCCHLFICNVCALTSKGIDTLKWANLSCQNQACLKVAAEKPDSRNAVLWISPTFLDPIWRDILYKVESRSDLFKWNSKQHKDIDQHFWKDKIKECSEDDRPWSLFFFSNMVSMMSDEKVSSVYGFFFSDWSCRTFRLHDLTPKPTVFSCKSKVRLRRPHYN